MKRIPVRCGRVRGVLYIPAGGGYFPGVIEMNGASGIFVEKRSGRLSYW